MAPRDLLNLLMPRLEKPLRSKIESLLEFLLRFFNWRVQSLRLRPEELKVSMDYYNRMTQRTGVFIPQKYIAGCRLVTDCNGVVAKPRRIFYLEGRTI